MPDDWYTKNLVHQWLETIVFWLFLLHRSGADTKLFYRQDSTLCVQVDSLQRAFLCSGIRLNPTH